MIFNTIHDVYHSREEVDTEGNLVQIDELIKEDVITPIYLDVTTIQSVMPQYSEKGVRYKKRMIVKANGDMYVLRHTFKEVTEILDNKSTVIGFRK